MARKCPACGETAVVRIVYGLIDDPEKLRRELGEDVILGGCCVGEGQPQWACRACGNRFRDEEMEGARSSIQS